MRNHVVFRPTVIIGLGGTGHGAILKLKKRFIDTYGSVPPIIRFLSIDTTENTDYGETTKDGSTVTIEPHERYVMSISNPAALINSTNEHIDKWWLSNIPTMAIMAGAGQVRARGRLALFANSRNIFTAIRSAVDDVTQAKGSRQEFKETFLASDRGGVDVYVVGSLSGGTGSGILLDIAFITRSFLDSLSTVTGVFVLPGVFRNFPGTGLVKSNAYGALKEIERFSNMTPTDSFTVDYGAHQLEVTQPPFDLLYLIDNINEEGNILTSLADILNIIAEGLYIQISSQAGTVGDNIIDTIKTHLVVAGQVRGRSAHYCSFGIASLTIPLREYETMKLYSARNLISGILLSDPVSDHDLENDVTLFIRDHKLNEDNEGNVTNALSERAGGGQLRFPMSLAQMKFDKAAGAEIKALHFEHRKKVDHQVLQEININYTRLLENVIQAIDDLWEQLINRAHGVNYAQRFAEKLLAKFEWYEHIMADQYREEAERLRAINFAEVEKQVWNAGSGLAFLGRPFKVRAACENYKGLVDRESELRLQMARCEKAAELYRSLCTHIAKMRSRCDHIRHNLEVTLSSFEQPSRGKTVNPSGETPFEQSVQFDAEAYSPEIEPEEFVQWHLREHGSLSAWAERPAEAVRHTIVAYINERYPLAADLSIDDVLLRSSPDVISQDLRQMSHKAAPLWRYDEGKIPLINRASIKEFYYYGVPNAGQAILKRTDVLGKVPHGEDLPIFVSTLDPHRITLLKVKVGVPLFALHGIFDMERAYNDPDKTVSNHVHRDWEFFPNIIPRAVDSDALRWFAIALAPEPFNLITRRGELYYIRSQQAKDSERGELRLGQGRLNAFRAFEMNHDLIKEIEEKIGIILRTREQAEIMRTLHEYAEQLQKQVAAATIDYLTKEHVESEIQSIDSFLQSLVTTS